jgi:hypothetical protein
MKRCGEREAPLNESKMPTVTELIELCEAQLREIFAPIDAKEDLFSQAKQLLELDGDNTQRLHWFRQPEPLPIHLRVKFSPFLAETLLRDGSLLLDRAISERREYHDLAVKWFEARVQVDELLRLVKITADEEQKLYNMPAEISEAEAAVAKQQNIKLTQAATLMEDAANDTAANRPNVINRAYSAAVAEAAINHGDQHWGYPGYSIPDLTLRDHAYFAAESAARQNVTQQEKIARSQQKVDEGEVIASEGRRQGSEKSAEYKRSQSRFQTLRNDVSRLVALRRAWALRYPGGELNYQEQMKPLKIRIYHDTIAAWLRLSAAAEGFDFLYGYRNASFPIPNIDGEIHFDDLVTWCQVTNAWLASFQDQQQVVTRSFSLTQVIGKDAFGKGLQGKTWPFLLRASDFSNWKLIRLRGLAVQIQTNQPHGSWNVSLTPPKDASVFREGLTQEHVGTLYLGRIADRTYMVAPEAAAPPKLHNTNPLGEWMIEVIGTSTSASVPHKNDIQDIDIHVTVAIAS